MENKEKKDDPKMIEKFSLVFRKKWITNRTITAVLICLLISTFIGINLYTIYLDLPEIDVTANKIYTLSDASKNAVRNIEKDITIYIYGFDENTSLVDFIKQYRNTNEHISYEILTEETNLDLVREYDLSEGYQIIIIKSGESRKIIDANTLYTYDYTTLQQIDVTEQTITNSILGMLVENKPKVYFVGGHGEFPAEETMSLKVILENESFEVNYLNILTNGSIPEDCNVLTILSPATDFLDAEAEAIINYINKGGNIFLTSDIVKEETLFPNLQKILDLYGVRVDRGYVVEQDSNYIIPNYPNIFMPQVSSENIITRDINTDSYIYVVLSQRLSFISDEELATIKVTREDLLTSTDGAAFITDLSNSPSLSSAEMGRATVSAILTKTIDSTEPDGESKQSKLILTATGSFLLDTIMSELSSSVTMSSIGSNRDFAINSIATLADKENLLTIRKDMSAATYMPTETQNTIVMIVIFIVPLIIIIAGIIVWNLRKKRK